VSIVRARAPLDVDLEDKLLYGLTPMRLAYLVSALLGGFTLWSSPWAPSPVRTAACLAVVGIGAAAAWGRWRGRAVDAWIADIWIFVVNTRRVTWNKGWVPRLNHRPAGSRATRLPKSPIEIVVAGRAPKAGATTLALELSTCLAAHGHADGQWSVRPSSPRDEHKPSASSLLVSVAAVDAGRVCYLDRGAGPYVAGLIPEDDCVRQAAMLKQATVVAFPDAPASRAFRDLAEAIAAGDS
jgi:hypothetical protein